jgi:HD-like signal output (HDOD) protein
MEGTTFNYVQVGKKVEAGTLPNKGTPSSMAEEMKNIRKMRLSRKVLQDPSLASKLVVAQNSPVYNMRGELLQTVSTALGNV